MITKSGVRLGVAMPQGFPAGSIDMALIRRFAARAEALGFDDLWVSEQITGRLAVLEPLTLLSYLAAVTQRVRLGVSILVLNIRNPVQVAKAISSLDHLCNGRLTVGVALGPSTRLYPAYGLPEERRVARFVEGLQVMRALWTEPQVTFQGEFQRLEAVSMEPKPLQQPHPPLWFGARAPAALKRAAAFGAGWMGAGSSSTSDFLTEVEGMRAALAGQGRDPAGFTLSKRVYISIGRDRESALERMRPWIGAFYGNPQLADRWAVAGTVEQCLEGLRPLVAAGAQHLLLNPVDGVMEHLEAFAAEIAPQL